MKITEEYYTANMNGIEERYINLANELADQILECMDWSCETKEVNAQLVTALWLKCNETKTMETGICEKRVKNEMIDKACEWLLENCFVDMGSHDTDVHFKSGYIHDFLKAMREEICMEKYDEEYLNSKIEAYGKTHPDGNKEDLELLEEMRGNNTVELGKGLFVYKDAYDIIVSKQRAIDIDKACKWFGNYLMDIGCPDDWMRDSKVQSSGEQRFRKAMEE